MGSEPEVPQDLLQNLSDGLADRILREVNKAASAVTPLELRELEEELARIRGAGSSALEAVRAVVLWALTNVPGLGLRGIS